MRNKSGQSKYKRRDKSHPANGKAQPQGLVTEAGDGIHGVLDTAQEAELAFATAALLAIVVDDGGTITNPRSKAGQIAVAFAQAANRLQDLPVQQAKNACVQRNGKVGNSAQQPIENRKQQCQGLAFFLTATSDSGHHLSAA